jgi:GNAT superfamily N-acetyltransferase
MDRRSSAEEQAPASTDDPRHERLIGMFRGTDAAGDRMSESRIRSAQRADAEALAQLSGELGYATDGAAVARRLAGLLASSDNAVLVALGTVDDVLGWVHVFVSHRLESSSFAEIGGLVVSEGARGRGIGRGLLVAAERWARDRGLSTMRIRSNVVRADAHGFYRHLGYEISKKQAVFDKLLGSEGR